MSAREATSSHEGDFCGNTGDQRRTRRTCEGAPHRPERYPSEGAVDDPELPRSQGALRDQSRHEQLLFATVLAHQPA